MELKLTGKEIAAPGSLPLPNVSVKCGGTEHRSMNLQTHG